MSNLEVFINDEDSRPTDPLLRMAIMHHQFETIHPFPDGNGRTGRILNILYLVMTGLLDLPILYMSRFITSTKQTYYELLQTVRDTGDWEAWLLYMLDGVEVTARHAIGLVGSIKDQMASVKNTMRSELPKIYSQDLLNNIFRHPYTKIAYVENELSVSRVTATKYLEALVAVGILTSEKVGRDRYFMNDALIGLFFHMPRLQRP
jgi:Fic family protein